MLMPGKNQTLTIIEKQSDWLNWPLLILIALVPLQNIYLGKIPSLGSGLNILNILMIFAFIAAAKCSETQFANNMNRYVLLLAASYIISLFQATLVLGWNDKSPEVLKDMFFAYLFFFVTYKSLTGMRAMKAVFYATVLPLPYMFRVFYSNLSWMGFSAYSDKQRLNSGTFLLLGSNEIAAFYATYTFIVFAVACVEDNKKLKYFLYACTAFNVYSLLYALSRGAYLAFITGIVVYCWLQKKTKVLIGAIVLLVVLAGAGADIFPKAVTERFDSSFVAEEQLDEGAQTRLILWDIAMEKFQGNPLLGVGFGNFKKMNEYGLDTHNYYIKLLAEGGIISLLPFLALLIAAYRISIGLFRSSNDKFISALACGFAACVTAMLVGNFFGDRFTHYPLIAYFFVYLAMIVKAHEWTYIDSSYNEVPL